MSRLQAVIPRPLVEPARRLRALTRPARQPRSTGLRYVDDAQSPSFTPGFLETYADARQSINGWFQLDAAILFIICNQLNASRNALGDVLEIGVHHGLSAIISAGLRGSRNRFYAVDLFEDLQGLNTSGSGHGSKAAFLENMRAFYPDLRFMEVIVGPSSQLSRRRLGSNFSFCHIDGGHSRIETYKDIELCYRLLRPGGLLALDDYFNEAWPGVSEGALRYAIKHPSHFVPLAIGFNKVVLQKPPVTINLAAYFDEYLPDVPRQPVDLWGSRPLLFADCLSSSFDLEQSTPGTLRIRPRESVQLRLESDTPALAAQSGAVVRLPVRVVNEATEALLLNRGRIGVSYHLLTDISEQLRWDNARAYLQQPLLPGESCVIELVVDAPSQPGSYRVQLDAVWEGVAWLSNRGLPPVVLELHVE